MAKLKIRKVGDDCLRKVCRPVEEITPRVLTLLDDMTETMRAADGVGLAAPQVGILRRIVVIEVEEGNVLELINPKIIATAGEQEGAEGCLSVPGKTGVVTRPNYVKVAAFDADKNPYELEGTELLARAICHELDHLDGHLYVEKVEGELQNADQLQEEEE